MARASQPFVAPPRHQRRRSRELPMAALRDICESIGCTSVQTYVQSGTPSLEAPLPAAKASRRDSRTRSRSRWDSTTGGRPPPRRPRPGREEQPVPRHPGPVPPRRFLSDKPDEAGARRRRRPRSRARGIHRRRQGDLPQLRRRRRPVKKLGKVPFEKRLGVAMTARDLRNRREARRDVGLTSPGKRGQRYCGRVRRQISAPITNTNETRNINVPTTKICVGKS